MTFRPSRHPLHAVPCAACLTCIARWTRCWLSHAELAVSGQGRVPALAELRRSSTACGAACWARWRARRSCCSWWWRRRVKQSSHGPWCSSASAAKGYDGREFEILGKPARCACTTRRRPAFTVTQARRGDPRVTRGRGAARASLIDELRRRPAARQMSPGAAALAIRPRSASAGHSVASRSRPAQASKPVRSLIFRGLASGERSRGHAIDAGKHFAHRVGLAWTLRGTLPWLSGIDHRRNVMTQRTNYFQQSPELTKKLIVSSGPCSRRPRSRTPGIQERRRDSREIAAQWLCVLCRHAHQDGEDPRRSRNAPAPWPACARNRRSSRRAELLRCALTEALTRTSRPRLTGDIPGELA